MEYPWSRGIFRPHEPQFLEARSVEDRNESQGSRFQDHRSYSGVGLAACMHAHMRVSARRRKHAKRARERASERERESAEVEDAGERRTRSIYAGLFLLLRSPPREPASHGERDVIDRTFHRALRAVPAPSRTIAREFLECSSALAETMLTPKQLGHTHGSARRVLSLLLNPERPE